jgi:hypothetical protein
MNCNANYREGFTNVNWLRKYYDQGNYTGAYKQDNYAVLKFHTDIAAIGADYSLNKSTTIGVSVTGEKFHLGTKGYYFANVLDQSDQLQSYFVTNNSSAGNWNNYSPNLHFMHAFDSTGKELTVDADYARYWNRNYQDFTTMYFLPNGTANQQPYMLHGDIQGVTQIRSLKADER